MKAALMGKELLIPRRRLLMAAGAGGLMLAGCDKLSGNPGFVRTLSGAESWTKVSQHLAQFDQPLAKEYRVSDISPVFKPNGSTAPDDEAYQDLADDNFVNWRLKVDGLVDRPLSLSLDDIHRLPARTQITRHDCVEGWSAIGQWTGVRVGTLLRMSGVKPNARYLVFHCADTLDGEPAKGGEESPGQYYESIGMHDAVHPQTIMAYALNGKPLMIANGAPLRLRVERQLGYKQAKYVTRIEVADDMSRLGKGHGGYWEDRGYEWYAGI